MEETFVFSRNQTELNHSFNKHPGNFRVVRSIEENFPEWNKSYKEIAKERILQNTISRRRLEWRLGSWLSDYADGKNLINSVLVWFFLFIHTSPKYSPSEISFWSILSIGHQQLYLSYMCPRSGLCHLTNAKRVKQQ